MMRETLRVEDLDALIFDFDGVLTDDRVFVDQNGKEMVQCHRRDGLAFDTLRTLGVKLFILSTEKNLVVQSRARKLRVPVLQGLENKAEALKTLAGQENLDLLKILYVGNDINDLQAMRLCGFSACPSDSHPSITRQAYFLLKTKGGSGVVRELVEDVFGIDIAHVLYS